MAITTRKSDFTHRGNFVFTQSEAKLRRLLREAVEQANRLGGLYANRELPLPSLFGGHVSASDLYTREVQFSASSRSDVIATRIYRLGPWGACVEALLAGGLETKESMEVFYKTNEWSHPRCAPLKDE